MMVMAVGFSGLTLGIAWLLSPRRASAVKDATYECGVDPVGDARIRHSIRFYVVAMLFIVFDLETVFLYPWAVTYKQLGLFGLAEMIVFLVILLVGYVYCWKRGALGWSDQIPGQSAPGPFVPGRALQVPRVGRPAALAGTSALATAGPANPARGKEA